MPTLAENGHLTFHFFFHRPTEKCTGVTRQKWISKWLFLRRHKKKQPKEKINGIDHKRKLLQNEPNISRIRKLIEMKMMDKVHVYMCSYIASIKSTAGNKTRLFPSPLLLSITWLLILAGAFRNDHVAACKTALHSATEKNEIGGYVTVPCSSKMTQRSSAGDWFEF